MARKARETSGTGIYHVMLRGINRQDIFNDDEDFHRFLQVLYQMVCPSDEITGKQLPARCIFYAYCVMTNHVHLLVRESSENLASVIKRIAVSYAHYYNKKYLRYGHLFQDRFKSEPVNDSAYFFTLLQYIHQNPVAAGMTANVSSYPWSSWHEYERAGSGIQDICSTGHVLSRMPIQELREHVNTLLPKTVDPFNIQLLSKDKRNEILREAKDLGATYRQLVRLTGLSYAIIRKA